MLVKNYFPLETIFTRKTLYKLQIGEQLDYEIQKKVVFLFQPLITKNENTLEYQDFFTLTNFIWFSKGYISDRIYICLNKNFL